MANTRNTDPLVWNSPIVYPDTGFPTPEFLRQFNGQRTLNEGLVDVIGLLDLNLIAGVGLSGGGLLGDLNDITFNLEDTTVTPATYGDSTHVAQFTVDQQGRITSASAVAISGGSGGSSVSSWNDPAAVGLTKPVAANFTVVNSTLIAGAATVSNLASRGIKFYVPATVSAGLNVAYIYVAKPAASDYVIDACIQYNGQLSNAWGGGICIRDNAGKLVVWGLRNGLQFWYAKWTDVNNFSAATSIVTNSVPSVGQPHWLRLQKTGSTFNFYLSFDGENWVLMDTRSTTDFLGATVDRVGIFFDNQSSGSPPTRDFWVNCFSWTAA